MIKLKTLKTLHIFYSSLTLPGWEYRDEAAWGASQGGPSAVVGHSWAPLHHRNPSHIHRGKGLHRGHPCQGRITDFRQQQILFEKRLCIIIAANLTSLASCVSAGGSCHVLVGWISPFDLCHNPGTHRGSAVPCPCPTPWEVKESNLTSKLRGSIVWENRWLQQVKVKAFVWPTAFVYTSLRLTCRSSHLCACPPSLLTGHSHFSPVWICPFFCGRTRHHCLPSFHAHRKEE